MAQDGAFLTMSSSKIEPYPRLVSDPAMRVLMGSVVSALGTYLLLTRSQKAEKWEREGREPGGWWGRKPPVAKEIRLRGLLTGSFYLAVGLGLLILAIVDS